MFRSSKTATVLVFCAVLASQPRTFSQNPNKGDARNPIQATDASPETKPQATPPNETNKLQPLVDAYFLAEEPPARRKILRQITKLKGATIETVATAIRNAKLWDAVEAGGATFPVVQPTINSSPHIARVTMRVPEGYDPTHAYPLLFAFPDTGTIGESLTETIANWLPANSEPFLIAAIQNASGVWLGSDEAEAGGVLAILDALKHRYHIDTDRVYVMGDGLGGHAAFVVATLYSDVFAAAVVVEGTLALQLGPEAAEVLLPNLHHTPSLVTYRQTETLSSAPLAPQTVTVWNRYLATVARDASLPLRFVELPQTQSRPQSKLQFKPRTQAQGTNSTTDIRKPNESQSKMPPIAPPANALREILKTRRPHAPKRVAHTFRYQPQGSADWLRLTTFLGDPWTAQRIVVEPALGETKTHAIKAVLHEKLANISGTIEGQTVRLESRNADRLELRLSADMLDLEKKITIYRNGTKRYTGLATPRINTMLEIAQEDWNFQGLYSVRFRIGNDDRARQY